jgi:thymidylate synthase (FAD)
MKIINASYEIVNKDKINGLELLKDIERVGRTCYKSEENITDDSAANFVGMLIKRGHEAMIEHNSITVKFTCDRGVSHELVRHRLASFGQESTRYCNYSKDKFGNELTFIKPCWLEETSEELINHLIDLDSDIKTLGSYNWVLSMRECENRYFTLLNFGWSPQEARSVLPNSLKTEIVMTMNIREWRHFFGLRCDTPAHPQMRELTIPLLKEMSELIPIVFDDLVNQFIPCSL